MNADTINTLMNSYYALPAWILAVILIWSLVWKGLALWKASKSNHLVWFVILLVLNTFGIIEILYIFIFSEIGRKNKKPARSIRSSRRK